MAGWINGNIEPKKDGYYLTMVGFGELSEHPMMFTVEGGWNTYKESPDFHDRRKDADYINSDGYIKAWYEAPPYVPTEVAG